MRVLTAPLPQFLALIGTLGTLVAGVDNTILSRVDTRTIVKPGPEPYAEFIDPEQVAVRQKHAGSVCVCVCVSCSVALRCVASCWLCHICVACSCVVCR